MGKIIIEGSSVAEVIALALAMQGGGSAHNTTVMHAAAALAGGAGGGEDGPEENGPVNTAAPAFDAAGLPWDERIHSSTKDLNGDGKWRARRKSKGQPDDTTIAAVEAELRARVGGGAVAQTQQPMQQMQMQPVQQVMQPIQQQPMQQMQQTQPMVQQQPVQQVMQPQPMQPVQQVQQQPAEMDFSTFMQTISKGFTVVRPDGSALVDQSYMAAIAVHFGLTAITDLSTRVDLIPAVINQFKIDGRWLGA